MRKIFALALVVVFAGTVHKWFSKPVPEPAPETEQSAPKNSAEKTEKFVLTYKIRKGDSISLIAHRFGVPTETLTGANIIKNDIIYEGEILAVPLKTSEIARLHTVLKGQTLSSIANLYGTSVEALMKINGMEGDRVFASGKIVVRKTPEINPRFVVFKVAPGDTMSEISRAFGMSAKETGRINFGSNPPEAGSHIVIDTFKYSYPRHVRESIIETASSYLGAPYLYGGNSAETGIDCSAFVKEVFSFFGVRLPRTVRAMHKHAKGIWIPKNRLRKGDLVFFETDRPFPSHIGIYISKGNFIHASSAQKRVAVSNLSEPYYSKAYIGAKRIYIRSENSVALRDRAP